VSAPLEPLPPTPTVPPPVTEAPPVPARGRWTLVVFAIVIGLVAAGFVLWYAYTPGGPLNPTPRVDVTQVVWAENGFVEAATPGFVANGGQFALVSVSLYCANGSGPSGPEPQTCSSGNPVIETPGFRLVSTDAPFQWSSGTAGASATLTVGVTTPTHAYTGNLTIEIV
jgi:hypothetical protein